MKLTNIVFIVRYFFWHDIHVSLYQNSKSHETLNWIFFLVCKKIIETLLDGLVVMTLKACMGKNARPSGVWTQLQAPGLQ